MLQSQWKRFSSLILLLSHDNNCLNNKGEIYKSSGCFTLIKLLLLLCNHQHVMRPNSQREYSNSAQKPEFQTKLKSRLAGTSDLKNSNGLADTDRMAQTQRSHHNHGECMFK